MRPSLQLAALFSLLLALTACTHQTRPAKNPARVALYQPDQSPHAPYRIIGHARVSRYNLLGTERESVILDDMMKKMAASIGGDGLINIENNDDSVEGHVIAYEKILI